MSTRSIYNILGIEDCSALKTVGIIAEWEKGCLSYLTSVLRNPRLWKEEGFVEMRQRPITLVRLMDPTLV